jgi:hypothetical protein
LEPLSSLIHLKIVGCPFKKEHADILCGSTFDKEKVRKSFTKELSIWLQEELISFGEIF